MFHSKKEHLSFKSEDEFFGIGKYFHMFNEIQFSLVEISINEVIFNVYFLSSLIFNNI